MKRFLDLVLVLLVGPWWLVIIGLTAIAVRLFMGAPVFFRQERAGLNGKPFRILKFRTMREGSGKDGERLTFLGRVLRRTSLDELPELWNILRGEMSFVGPRPLPTAYLPRYSAEQARRHEVRPGLTGWAQVNGRNTLDWETKFRYDVWYVDNRSFALDLKILLKTIWICLAGSGVNHEGEATMREFMG